jgi:ATP-binding cassette, subfamily B, bacterial
VGVERDPVASGEDAQRRPQTIDDVLRPSASRDLRRFPRMVAQAFGLVWRAASRQLLWAGGLQILAGLSVAGQLLVLRSVLDRMMGANGVPALATLSPQLAAFAILLTVVAVAGVAKREQQRLLSEHVAKFTLGQVMDVSTSVDLLEFDRSGFFDQLERARINASVRPLQIAQGIIGLLGGVATVAAVGAALILLEPLVAGLVVVGGLPSLYLNRLSSRAFHAYSVRETPGQRRRAYLFETLTRKEEAHEVRAFNNSGYLRAEHDRLYDNRIAATGRLVRRRMLYGTLGALSISLTTVGSLALLLLFVRAGRLSIADAATAVGALVLLGGRLQGLVSSGGVLYEGSLFLEDFTGFVEDGRRLAKERVELTAPPAFSMIELHDVGFTYPSRSEPSLQDVSLSIRRGEVIALVGENGSGKTTLTKLLAGLYRPSAGRLLWDGEDTAAADLAALREHVAVIFQDFARYFMTAHENIAISRPDRIHDHAAVLDAAKDAGAERFLEELPDGLASLLGPAFAGGSDLSLGQWQRVALARAYFRDAPLLILDEPTASLDPRGEYEIFQQVRRLAEGRTVVLVSHRFSSVRAADRILVLDRGRIVEEGSHAQLLGAGGLYAELFNLQAAGYRSTDAGTVF